MRRRLVTFDWALKRLLRSKANFDILEGFLTELFRRDVTVLEIIESESNKQTVDDKFNRVDIMVKLDSREIVIVEFQSTRDAAFFQRILYGTSKVVTEHMDAGMPYDKVFRVISVNVLFFGLGAGPEYIYHGQTTFKGFHTNEKRESTSITSSQLRDRPLSEIFPEYYLLDVRNFDDVARDSLDQWIYFLKNGKIPDEFNAQGIGKARRVFDLLGMSNEDRIRFEKYVDARRTLDSEMLTMRNEGVEVGIDIGLIEGRKEGIEEKAKEIALKMLDKYSNEQIAEITGLSVEDLALLRKE